MNRMLSVRVGIVCCLVSVFLSPTYAHADEASPTLEQEVQSFGNGIVMITVERTVGSDRYSTSATLKDAKVVKLGDRYFIRGIGYVAKIDKNNSKIVWFNGVDASYAWDGVVEFYVFTPEELEKYRKWVQQQEQ